MKIILLFLALLLTSCSTTVTSPNLKIDLTGEISEKGISLTVKPPFWGWCVDLYKNLNPKSAAVERINQKDAIAGNDAKRRFIPVVEGQRPLGGGPHIPIEYRD